MLNYIHELYQHELESKRLAFESDPGYRDALAKLNQRYEAIWDTGDHKLCEALYSSCFDLVHFSSRSAFYHGMRLGMALICWGGGGLSGL